MADKKNIEEIKNPPLNDNKCPSVVTKRKQLDSNCNVNSL